MASEFQKIEFKNFKVPYITAKFLNDLQDEVIRLGNEECGSGSSGLVIQKVEKMTIPSGTVITNGYEITLPISYTVGNSSLSLYWEGSRLVLATDTTDGHYKEVGNAGDISNKIQMHRTTEDGTYTLLEDVVLEAVVIYNSDTLPEDKELYSNEEIKTNKYYEVADGLYKPVYRRIFEITTGNVDLSTFNILIENVQDFFNFDCRIYELNATRPYNFLVNNNRLPLDFIIINGNLCYRVVEDAGANKTIKISVNYTKNNDGTISLNNEEVV